MTFDLRPTHVTIHSAKLARGGVAGVLFIFTLYMTRYGRKDYVILSGGSLADILYQLVEGMGFPAPAAHEVLNAALVPLQ